MPPIIVTGIHTNIGKTIVSSILVEALGCDYWKPLQTGMESDRARVKELITNRKSAYHPESYWLKSPLSPHHAAKLEGVAILPSEIVLPQTKRALIIEGSGGVLSPLNDSLTQLDFFSKWKAIRILVVKHYLGSINHTLLSVQALQPFGLIFNGIPERESEEFILNYTQLPCLGRIPFLTHINRRTIRCQALAIKPLLKKIVDASGTLLRKQNER